MPKCWHIFLFIITVSTVFAGEQLSSAETGGKVTLRMGTVNNPDMILLKELAGKYYNKNIEINWVVQDENTLRQNLSAELTLDDESHENQGFDVITIGSHEVPFLFRSYEASHQSGEKQKEFPLKAFDSLPEDYDVE